MDLSISSCYCSSTQPVIVSLSLSNFCFWTMLQTFFLTGLFFWTSFVWGWQRSFWGRLVWSHFGWCRLVWSGFTWSHFVWEWRLCVRGRFFRDLMLFCLKIFLILTFRLLRCPFAWVWWLLVRDLMPFRLRLTFESEDVLKWTPYYWGPCVTAHVSVCDLLTWI